MKITQIETQVWHGHGAERSTAIAGIDLALWDIAGKIPGVPCHKLWGGAVRDTIRLYCHLGGGNLESFYETPVDNAKQFAVRGGGRFHHRRIDTYRKTEYNAWSWDSHRQERDKKASIRTGNSSTGILPGWRSRRLVTMKQAFSHPSFHGRIGVACNDITPPVGIYARNWGVARHDVADLIHRSLTLTALTLAPVEGGEAWKKRSKP